MDIIITPLNSLYSFDNSYTPSKDQVTNLKNILTEVSNYGNHNLTEENLNSFFQSQDDSNLIKFLSTISEADFIRQTLLKHIAILPYVKEQVYHKL